MTESRNDRLEEAAAVCEQYALASYSNEGFNEFNEAAAAIRALKQEGVEAALPEPRSGDTSKHAAIVQAICNSLEDSPGCIYPKCDCNKLPKAIIAALLSPQEQGIREALEMAERAVETWGDGNPPIVVIARALIALSVGRGGGGTRAK